VIVGNTRAGEQTQALTVRRAIGKVDGRITLVLDEDILPSVAVHAPVVALGWDDQALAGTEGEPPVNLQKVRVADVETSGWDPTREVLYAKLDLRFHRCQPAITEVLETAGGRGVRGVGERADHLETRAWEPDHPDAQRAVRQPYREHAVGSRAARAVNGA